MKNCLVTTSIIRNSNLIITVRSLLRGAGQVMFQQSALTGLLFLAGIIWGSYETHSPLVAWGGMAGLIASTIAGWITPADKDAGAAGLWGFNGILVGCAFPTFLENSWQMWLALIFCSMLTPWVRAGMNNIMAAWKINSLTFPFVFLTWIFLLASGMMDGISLRSLSVTSPMEQIIADPDYSFGRLVIYWLKGVSQIFLINSWVTGIFFLAGLALCSLRAAFWAAAGSAISLFIAIVFGADSEYISAGLFGFSPALTGIAIGCTFYKPSLKSAILSVIAIITTVFVQSAMGALFSPLGLPVLTGPFCVTTWLFLLPPFRFDPSA